jgi:hypothetical protein
MGKLHELLAVESSLEKTARKLSSESMKTLDKENLFSGQTRRLEMFSEEESNQDQKETVQLTSTVDENLNYVFKEVAKYWDVVYQKDLGNTVAMADIVVDGLVLAEDVPATTLLGLESKLVKVREVLEKVHTLAPGIKWIQDTQERAGVWITADDIVQYKTEKTVEYIIAAEATEQHPAQVREASRTRNVGKLTTTKQSGLLTPLEKAERIQRVDNLINAIKRARNRANDVVVEPAFIGETLINYIMD